MFGLPIQAWVPEIPPLLLNALSFVLGALFGSLVDYVLRERNRENQMQKERDELVREWNTQIRRIIKSLEQNYDSVDANKLDERNEIREEIQSTIESVKEQKDTAPAAISWGMINQINTLIHEEDELSGTETPTTTATVVKRRPGYQNFPPSRSSSPSSSDSEDKEKRAFEREMESFLSEAQKLANMCENSDS